MPTENISRRTVLHGIAAGAAATGIAGKATGQDDREGPLDRTIVGLTADAGFEVAADRATEVRHQLDFGDIGKAVAGQFPDQAIEALENNPQVRYVEQDQPARAFQTSYGIPQVSADVTQQNGETGASSDVAIVDTGVQVDHPDLNVVGGAAFGTTCSDCPEPYGDDNGHGTHCAGTAASTNPDLGVATDAEIYSVKVLNSFGSGDFSDVAAGVEWAADQGIDVISMSLGGSSHVQALEDACDYARNQGSFVVAAAGNDGECCDCVAYPAAYDSVVAVSATDSNDDIAGFSSTGPHVDVAAPGVDITSTYLDSGYDTLSGTSMACPHVAGGAALLMADGYSNTQAENELLGNADDICLCDGDQGAGRLNVAAPFGFESPDDCGEPERDCQNCSDDGGCYITTATAGEGDSLDALRRFRDESMGTTPVGRALVGLYYRISPPIADTLARHPESRTTRATREIVELCADLSNRQDRTDSRIASASLGAALTMLYVVGIAVGAGGHAGISLRERIEDA